MTNGSILTASLGIGAALTAFALLLQQALTLPPDDALREAVARQALRVEAARASLDAQPLIGESHLPSFDSKRAVAREESELRRLSSLQQASH